MHLMRSIPTSPTTTRQEYDVYRLNTPHATPEAHQRMTDFYRNVVNEDFELCEQVQTNLERGIFERGPLHPFHEEGVMAFQRMLVRVLREQVKLEEEAGRELWAAKPGGQRYGTSEDQQNSRSLCDSMLVCEKTKSKGLEW